MDRRVKYFIIVLIMFISCEKNSNNFLIHNIKVKECNLTVNSILSKNNDLYLLGYCEKGNLTDREATIYKSTISIDKKPKKITLGKGVIKNAFIIGDFIYIIKEIFTENSFNNIENYLCKYDIVNNSTKTLLNIKGVTMKIFFENDEKGFIVIRVKDNHILKSTIDGGRTWGKDLVIKNVESNLFSTNKVSFSREDTNVNEGVITSWTYSGLLFNLRNSKKFEVKLDEFCVDDNKSIWGLTKENNQINIYKRTDKLLSKIYGFEINDNFFPKVLYKYNNFIGVLLGETNSFGTINHLYLSFDEGITFKEEKLFIDNYVKPIYFYKDEKIIIYSGAGRISVCDLKK